MCAEGTRLVPPPAGTRFGPIRHFAQIDSTNRYLLDEARAGAPEGAVAVADYQSAGRGRLGRRWEAPPGSNLLVSVLLRPALAVEELHLCTVTVALAAAAACERGAGLAPDLKWPNDLVVGGRKLGGILAEALPTAPASAPAGVQEVSPVVVGLGLNVGWPPPDSDLEIGPDDTGLDADRLGATSLRRETTTELEPLVVLGLLLEELEARLIDLADAEGRRRLTAQYRRRCTTVGRAVRVSLAEEVFTGTAADITAEGHLIVDVGACLRTVAAGDVVHLR
jgi:BirA family transcriptional regulator, biotin operon repressor / biotin---[acetyl-CoA-carboxylase] ligase